MVMNRVTRKVVAKVQDYVDSLHGCERQLENLKKHDAPIGQLTSFATRVHIYNGCTEIIYRYKRRLNTQELLTRTLKRIRLHIDQLRRLNNVTEKTLVYFRGLMRLMKAFELIHHTGDTYTHPRTRSRELSNNLRNA